MTQRLNPFAAAPAEMKAWYAASLAVASKLEAGLRDLVAIRASQINGCANCLAMHTAEARARGESEERIYLLDAWHEAPVYTDRERAALAWTDALTLVATARAPDALYAQLAEQFSDEEQVQLTLMINVINGWNRIAVGFGLWQAASLARAA